eukprot:3437979-Pleurochrysis_carterae.AAC.3
MLLRRGQHAQRNKSGIRNRQAPVAQPVVQTRDVRAWDARVSACGARACRCSAQWQKSVSSWRARLCKQRCERRLGRRQRQRGVDSANRLVDVLRRLWKAAGAGNTSSRSWRGAHDTGRRVAESRPGCSP